MGKELLMDELRLNRIDEIDNATYQCVCAFLRKCDGEFPWDMALIGPVSDAIETTLTELGHKVWRPSIVTDHDGAQHYEDFLPRWICTDEDSAQYVKQISLNRFDLIQLQVATLHNGYTVQGGIMEPMRYMQEAPEEAAAILAFYGYDGFADVVARYGPDAPQIAAECFFETLIDSYELLATGSEATCRAFIERYVKQDGLSPGNRAYQGDAPPDC